MPHSFHKSDKLANDYDFLNACKISWVKIANSVHDTYNYYKDKKMDLVFSQRLHSMILSEGYDISFIGFVYSKKTRELLK